MLRVFFIFISFMIVSKSFALDVFVAGDSQYSFQHHHGFTKFLSSMSETCSDNSKFSSAVQKDFAFAGYGASGSGLVDWIKAADTSNMFVGHGDLCRPEGGNRVDGNLERIPLHGTGKENIWAKACVDKKSAIDSIVELNPKVVVLTFLGRHTHRLDDGAEEASAQRLLEREMENWAELDSKLPADTGCIVVTSPPMFVAEKMSEQARSDLASHGAPVSVEQFIKNNKKSQKLRKEAADRIHQAVLAKTRCKLVKGFDQDILEKVSSDENNYTIKFNTGGYPDPYHISERGSYKFFEIKRAQMCEAFSEALGL